MVFWTLSSVENVWHIKYVLGKGDKSVLIEMELWLWRTLCLATLILSTRTQI